MAFTQDFRTQRRNYDDGDTRIGEKDRLWYDSITNTIRISDGETPGGIAVSGGSTAWTGSTDTIIKVAGSFAADQPFKSQVVANLTDGVSISTWMGIPAFATEKTWQFAYNGNMIFPDSTVQTTAYTATAVKGLFSVTTNSASGNGSLSYSNGVFTFTPASVPTSVTINGTAVTLGSSGTVTAAAGTLTGTTLNSSVVTSSLTSVGTITSGTWNGSVIGSAYLPTATTSALGAVKVDGSSIVIDGSGVISTSVGVAASLVKYVRTTQQTTGITANSVIICNVLETTLGSDITYNTTTGRATLAANRTYRLMGCVPSWTGSSNNVAWAWYNETTSAWIGSAGENYPGSTGASYGAAGGPADAVITVGASAITVSFRLLSVSGITLSALGGNSDFTTTGGYPWIDIQVVSGNATITALTPPTVTTSTATNSTSTSTGSIISAGGLGVALDTNLGGTLTVGNALAVTYAPASATGSAISATGKDTQGGTGYFDFFKATNTTSGVANGNKTFRLNSTGGIEVINSAYTATLLSLSDAGALSVSGSISVGSKKAVNGPAFRAYVATNQAITSGSQQTVTFASETFDTDGCFASNTFTPTVEGYYQFNATVRIDGPASTGESMIILYKNISEYARGNNEQGTEQGANFYSMQVSDIAYANGTTDSFHIRIQQTSGSNKSTTAGSTISYFSGCMIRGA